MTDAAATAPELLAALSLATDLGTPPWNVTGQPAMAVPAGVDVTGVPTGVQLVARPGEETTIIALAAQMERSAEE